MEKVEEETEGSGDFLRSTCLFMDSEKKRKHAEDEMIKIENIKGKLILLGADDDSFWEAGKYVRRMDQRLKERRMSANTKRSPIDTAPISYCPSLCSEWHCRRA